MRHLGDSITTAQWLNLDKEAGGYTLPLEDPALSLLSPWAGQELCNRLLHMLAFVEGTTATQGGRCRLIMGKGRECYPNDCYPHEVVIMSLRLTCLQSYQISYRPISTISICKRRIVRQSGLAPSSPRPLCLV